MGKMNLAFKFSNVETVHDSERSILEFNGCQQSDTIDLPHNLNDGTQKNMNITRFNTSLLGENIRLHSFISLSHQLQDSGFFNI